MILLFIAGAPVAFRQPRKGTPSGHYLFYPAYKYLQQNSNIGMKIHIYINPPCTVRVCESTNHCFGKDISNDIRILYNEC